MPATPESADDTAFFGHPRGLGWLFAAECGYSFAYWGMVSILTLYMTQELFLPGHVENIWGFAAYSQAMQAAFGRMSTLELASQTFGLITGLMYATPILGGILADRWLGHTRTVTIGFAVLAAGFALMVTEQGFLIAAALLVVGGGLIKSNLLGQIGQLYGPGDPRRTRAFGIFLIAVNVGGFLSPMIVGTLGETVGWTQGLIASAVGMAVGLAAYLVGRPHMPRVAPAGAMPEATRPAALARPDMLILIGLSLVLVVSIMNAGTYNQAFNIFPVWAKDHVDRTIGGFEMPVTWFSTLDGILTIAGTALAVRFWAWQDRNGQGPRETTRIGIGCLLTAAAFCMLTLGALAGPRAPIAFPLAFFALADAAIPWVDTVIMSLISRAAPPGLTTTLLGVYYLTFAAGNFLVGALGRLYEHMTPVAFWGVHVAIAGGAAVYMLVVGGWLNRLIQRRRDPQTAAATAAAG